VPLFSGAPNQIQPSFNSAYQPGGVLTPGYYSNLAYQMAGSPTHGPYAALPPPAAPPGGYGIPAGYSGGAGGGLLGSVGTAFLRNPKAVSGLFGGPSVDQYATQAGNQGAQYLSSTLPAPSSVTPPVTDPQGDLYAGAQNADADTASNEADTYAANGGLAGYLSNAPSLLQEATPSVTITDTAGNVLAGGQAADAASGASNVGSAGSSLGANLGTAAPVLGIYSGLQQGGAQGDTQAALSAAQLASKAGLLSPGATAALGAAGYASAGIALPFVLDALMPTKSDRPYDQQLSMLESLQDVDPSLYSAGMNVLNTQGPAALTGFFGGIFGPSGGRTQPTHATVQS
jgi:hypothetical protein